MNIVEAFEFMKANPGKRCRPLSLRESPYGRAPGDDVWFVYKQDTANGHMTWKSIDKVRGEESESYLGIWMSGDFILDEWEVEPEKPKSLAPLKRHVASLCRIRWMHMFQAVERADFEGKAFRIYLTERNGLSQVRPMLFGLDVFSPNYVTDRWDDRSAVALVDAEIWDKLTDEGKTSVREHHSEVLVFELEPRGEGVGR
jgi:hypothetical protein